MSAFFAFVFLIASSLSVSPSAQSMCGDRDRTVKLLEDRYSEQPAGLGIMTSQAVMELFVSKSGTWTLLATRSDGRTCIVGAGKNWQSYTPRNLDEVPL